MSAVSKMSLMPNGTPLEQASSAAPCRSSRALVNAASPARWLQARTTGSRSAIRSRQLRTTASRGQLAALDQANQAGRGKTMWFDFRHEGTPGRQWFRYLATVRRQAHAGIAGAYLPAPHRSAITPSAGRNDVTSRKPSRLPGAAATGRQLFGRNRRRSSRTSRGLSIRIRGAGRPAAARLEARPLRRLPDRIARPEKAARSFSGGSHHPGLRVVERRARAAARRRRRGPRLRLLPRKRSVVDRTAFRRLRALPRSVPRRLRHRN